MNRGTAVIIRPSLEALEAARLAIIKAVCKVAGYDEAAALASTREKFADVRYLVAMALCSRKAKVADALKVAGINGHTYDSRRHKRMDVRRRTMYHADKDLRVIRAALDAAAMTIPKCPKRSHVEVARKALEIAASAEGVPFAEAASSLSHAAIRARRRAIKDLRDRPLPWSVIVDGLGLSRVACMRAYYAATHGHPKRWPSSTTDYRHQRRSRREASAVQPAAC